MYQDFFGFTECPFSMTPNARFLYLSERHKEALSYLQSGLGQGGGFALLTGEVGTGKTTVSRALFSELNENIHLALILNPTFTALELFTAICDELKIEYSSTPSLKQLTEVIVEFLVSEDKKGFQTIVAIDEAQHLGPDVLEHLRLLTNFETDSDKLLKVLLIGQPELQQKLQQANLRQLAQRITARYHLLPLTVEDIQYYIDHRLQVVGSNATLFSSSAIKIIALRSKGIPRLINLLCDKALWVSYQQGEKNVNASSVKRACELVLEWEIPAVSHIDLPAKNNAPWLMLSIAIALSVSGTWGVYKALPSYLASTYPIVEQVKEHPLIGFDSEQAAFQQLLEVWGYETNTFQANCTNAKRAQLYCLDNNGSLNDLLALNRPAIVWLQQENGDDLLAIVYHISSKNIALLLPERQIEVSHQWFEKHWNGAYMQLWKKPIMTKRAMRLGDEGEAIVELNQLLSFALEQPLTDSNRFTEETEEQVKQFQAIFGLKTDGVVGSSTLMWLDSVINTNVPMLQGDK